MPGVAATVTLTNPLGADDAQRMGLTARPYLIGESITVEDWVAAALRRTGYASAAAPTSNTLLTGVGAPDPGIGANGSYYLDVSSTWLYGPKSAGSWPVAMDSGRRMVFLTRAAYNALATKDAGTLYAITPG